MLATVSKAVVSWCPHNFDLDRRDSGAPSVAFDMLTGVDNNHAKMLSAVTAYYVGSNSSRHKAGS